MDADAGVKMSKKLSKEEKQYLRISDTDVCCFCGIKDDTLVKHHLKIHTGAGMKCHTAGTVVACFECHAACHSGRISKYMQKKAWLAYTAEKVVAAHGEEKGFEMHCMAIWSIL